MRYLHDRGILHGDLKVRADYSARYLEANFSPQATNVLIDEGGRAVIRLIVLFLGDFHLHTDDLICLLYSDFGMSAIKLHSTMKSSPGRVERGGVSGTLRWMVRWSRELYTHLFSF